MRRMTRGETGSLKVSRSVGGGCASTEPSAGSARTSEACANACDACASASNSATRNAKRRMRRLPLRQQLQSRRRLRSSRMIVMAAMTGGNLNPAVHTLFAFLHHGEIYGLTGAQLFCERTDEHELVVKSVGEIAAGPGDLGHTLAHFSAAQCEGLGIFAADSVELPSRLRHRLNADDTGGNADADCGGSRTVTAMRNAQHRLVGRADWRLLGFKCDMRGCHANAKHCAGGPEKKLTVHFDLRDSSRTEPVSIGSRRLVQRYARTGGACEGPARTARASRGMTD